MTEPTASIRREMVDTNAFIYASDPTDPQKQLLAQTLLEDLLVRKALVVSVQVLNEFFNAATRPNKPPALPFADAHAIIRNIAISAEVVPLTKTVTLLALDAMPRHGFSFWDALVWAAAKENGVPVIYTEDFQDGRDAEGVRYVNPFATKN